MMCHNGVSVMCHNDVSQLCVTMVCHNDVSMVCHNGMSHWCVTMVCHNACPTVWRHAKDVVWRRTTDRGGQMEIQLSVQNVQVSNVRPDICYSEVFSWFPPFPPGKSQAHLIPHSLIVL